MEDKLNFHKNFGLIIRPPSVPNNNFGVDPKNLFS